MSLLTQPYDMDTSLRSTWNTASLAAQSSGQKGSHSTPARLNLLSFSVTLKTDSSYPLTTRALCNTYSGTSSKGHQLLGSHLVYLAHASLWALTQLNTPMDFITDSNPAWHYGSFPSPMCDRTPHLDLGNLAPSHPTSRSIPYRTWDPTQQKLWKSKDRTHLQSQGSCHRSLIIDRGK